MVYSQAYLFILFILNGVLIGLLFDIFRILRKSFKTSDIITYIEDIAFWIISGIVTLYFIIQYNNGEIRLYVFIGIILGIILYMLLISSHFIKINVKIIKIIKNIVGKTLSIVIYPINIVIKILKKILFRPISFIFINVRANIIKNIHNFTNNLKKTHKNQKNTQT